MSKKYEVWINGRLIGKRISKGRDYTHAIVGRLPKYTRDPVLNESFITGWGERLEALSFAGSEALAHDRVREVTRGDSRKDVGMVPVTVVKQWTRVDKEGYPIVTLAEAAEEFLDFMRDFVGGMAWDEITGGGAAGGASQFAVLQSALQREAEKQNKRTDKAWEEEKRKAEADRVDGYNRDDIPDDTPSLDTSFHDHEMDVD